LRRFSRAIDSSFRKAASRLASLENVLIVIVFDGEAFSS
jgi:hypothetical protein